MSQTHPYVRTPPSEEPPTKVVRPLALLMTRCGCERTIEIPATFPRTVTIELAPLHEGAKAEERVFYLKAKGSHPSAKEDIYLYQEGPAREKSLITVPGVTPPASLRRLA